MFIIEKLILDLKYMVLDRKFKSIFYVCFSVVPLYYETNLTCY